MRGGRPDADRAGIDGRLALVTGRGRGQGKARSGLACRPRVPLAGSPGARRHRDTGQLLHGHSRWPHQEPGHRAVRSSRPRREIHGRAGRQERDVHATKGHQVPQRRAGHAPGCEVQLRELPRRQGRRLQEEDGACRDRGRPDDPVPLQGTLPRFRHPLRDRQRRRPRLGGAREVLQAGGRRRLQAEARRSRPVQARPPRAGREARDGGLRRLLPARQREAARHDVGAGRGDPRRDAGAR